MTDPDPPEAPRIKGRFQPGNKAGKGRPKGAENKFGPGFRQKLLAGIARSGVKKAKKAGVNGKVDGFEYYIESLVDNNGGAAATLISRLIPPEAAPEAPKGPGVIVNVRSIAEGQQFLPGNEVLMPFEEATKAWLAYNGGVETWAAYLQLIEGQLTKAAFENLSRVPPFSREGLASRETPLLHLVPDDDGDDYAA
jgi:hypothetical protein